MGRKWWGIVAAVVLIAALVVVGCSSLPGAQEEAGTPDETAIAREGTLEVAVEATGNLLPHTEVSLSSSSGGRVAAVLVEEGQFVEAGQALVRLETDELALQVAQAEATLAAAEAQLAQLLAPARPEEVTAQDANVRAMAAQVSASAASRDQLVAGADGGEIASAEAELASAIAEQHGAFDRHENTMTCVTIEAGTRMRDGTILPEEMVICPALGAPEEQARYALAAADASLALAQARLDDLMDGPDVNQERAAQADVAVSAAQRDASQAQLELLLAGATQEQIDTSQASVDEARVRLDEAQLALEKATLTAPMAGIVTSLDLQPGQIVNANQAIVVLSDLAALDVEVSLDETDVARVAVGQEVRVTVDALPGVQIAGQVTRVASVAESQAGVVLYPVTVRLSPSGNLTAETESASGGLMAGMTAEVEISVATQENAVIVPLRAVHSEGERAYVERLSGGRVEQVAVELGLVTDTEVGITVGLAEGDEVVVIPAAAGSSAEFQGPFGMLGGENSP